MVNFEKQFDNILEKYQEIETSLSDQVNYNSEKLIRTLIDSKRHIL